MLRLLYLLIFGYWNKPTAITQKARRPKCKAFSCSADPSPLCWSGQCRHHCMQEYHTGCYCEKTGLTPQESKLISQYRQTQKAQQEKLAAIASDEQEILEEVRKVSQ